VLSSDGSDEKREAAGYSIVLTARAVTSGIGDGGENRPVQVTSIGCTLTGPAGSVGSKLTDVWK